MCPKATSRRSPNSFVRTGEVLTRISAITDPVYLTEPLVKSEEFVLNPQGVPHRS